MSYENLGNISDQVSAVTGIRGIKVECVASRKEVRVEIMLPVIHIDPSNPPGSEMVNEIVDKIETIVMASIVFNSEMKHSKEDISRLEKEVKRMGEFETYVKMQRLASTPLSAQERTESE